MNDTNGHGVFHAFRGVCQNPECRHAVIARIHIIGLGVVTVPCVKCGRLSKFEWAFAGVQGSLVETETVVDEAARPA